jgi:RHS repeat-associated protein
MAGLVAQNGSTTARYEYGPFGEMIRSSGDYASANPIRWSSKLYDDETGLSYYGLRYYTASLGRWANRDPIGEEGGTHLYAFLLNSPGSKIDAIGTSLLSVLPDPAEQDAQAAEAQQGASLISRVREMVDNFNDFQDIVSTAMDAANGDVSGLFEALLSGENNPMGRHGASKTPGFDSHHVFPRQFGEAFRDLDIDVDNFTVGLQRSSHHTLHSGRGMGPGGLWNRAWHEFLGIRGGVATAGRSREEVFKFGSGLLTHLLGL